MTCISVYNGSFANLANIVIKDPYMIKNDCMHTEIYSDSNSIGYTFNIFLYWNTGVNINYVFNTSGFNN